MKHKFKNTEFYTRSSSIEPCSCGEDGYLMNVTEFMHFQNAVCALKIASENIFNDKQIYEMTETEHSLLRARRTLSELEEVISETLEKRRLKRARRA